MPDRFTLIETVRNASSALGLKAPVIATLDALLSCLPPKRNHHFVFASNATLAFKRNGISDRTIRRHILQLAEAGLLARSDSPNRKRFSKKDLSTGNVLRFGFDLAPLYEDYESICALAEESIKQASHISYLRTKLRCAIARTLKVEADNMDAENAQRALRRKLDATTLERLLLGLVKVVDNQEDQSFVSPSKDTEMTVSDGQNVRHHHSSKKEPLDSDVAKKEAAGSSQDHQITMSILVEACQEAASYLQQPPESASDVIEHARTLAPMMGIDRTMYRTAEAKLGELSTAVTVWGLLQLQGKIRQLGAYFRAITVGEKSDSFDPWEMIGRLIKQKQLQRC